MNVQGKPTTTGDTQTVKPNPGRTRFHELSKQLEQLRLERHDAASDARAEIDAEIEKHTKLVEHHETVIVTLRESRKCYE